LPWADKEGLYVRLGSTNRMRVLEACRFGGYTEPEWHELGTVMRVVFYPHLDVSGLKSLGVPANVPVEKNGVRSTFDP